MLELLVMTSKVEHADGNAMGRFQLERRTRSRCRPLLPMSSPETFLKPEDRGARAVTSKSDILRTTQRSSFGLEAILL